MFEDLTNLEWFYLNFNDMQTLPGDVFNGLTRLPWLGLNGNALEFPPDCVFDNFSGLGRLYPYDNELITLPDGVFGELSSLRTLNLNSSVLTSLPVDKFKDRSSLNPLSIDENPGSPFTITAVREQRDGGVVVRVDEGTPFGMTVTLSIQGGTVTHSSPQPLRLPVATLRVRYASHTLRGRHPHGECAVDHICSQR